MKPSPVKPARLLGCQEPRLSLVPDGDDLRGEMAVQFARWCGLTLFPWQEWSLRMMCRTNTQVLDGVEVERWAAREVLEIVARQNGKGEILVARELAGIFLFGEKCILHTAHLMDTAIDAQKRLWEIIGENNALLGWFTNSDREGFTGSRIFNGVPVCKTGNGKECIEFPNGSAIHFRTRTAKTGRGLSIDLLIIDECYNLPNEIQAALSKAIRAREQAQIIYISSPVDINEHQHGAVMSAKRWSAIDGKKRMFFAEWSLSDDDDPLDRSVWPKCNPSLVTHGFGAQLEDIEMEAVDAAKSEILLRQFRVESLGSGFYYPRDDEAVLEHRLIDVGEWGRLVELGPVRGSAPVFVLGFDVARGGARAALVVASTTKAGVPHLDLTPVGDVTRESFVEKVLYFIDVLDPVAVVGDPGGPANPFVHALHDARVDVLELSGSKVASATELLLQSVHERAVTHDGDGRWVDQWERASLRGEASKYRAFNRYGAGEVTALNAAAFALYGLREDQALPVVEVHRSYKYSGVSVTGVSGVELTAESVMAMQF